VEHREVPMEEATVKSSETMKKRHRGWHLTTGRCGEPKGLNQGDCGSRRKLTAACRKVSRHAAVIWHKRNVFRNIWAQGNCGLWKELAAAGRRMTHSTEVAQRRGHDRKRYDQDDVVQETWRGWTFRKRRWKGPACNNGIRDRGLRQQATKEPRHKTAAASSNWEDIR
jgi:hypothetical protein